MLRLFSFLVVGPVAVSPATNLQRTDEFINRDVSVLNSLIEIPLEVYDDLTAAISKGLEIDKIVYNLTERLDSYSSQSNQWMDFKAYWWTFFVLNNANSINKALVTISEKSALLTSKSIREYLVPAMYTFRIDSHWKDGLNLFLVVPMRTYVSRRQSVRVSKLLVPPCARGGDSIFKVTALGDPTNIIPYNNIRTIIESIPVESRLILLKDLATTPHPPAAVIWQSYQFDLLPEHRLYIEFVMSHAYIDPTVLGILFRYGAGRLSEGETHLNSASDIIEYLQSRYTDGRFNYLTPDYLVTWSMYLRNPTLRVATSTDPKNIIERLKYKRDSVGDRGLLVGIPDHLFRDTLKKRSAKLIETGYELSV